MSDVVYPTILAAFAHKQQDWSADAVKVLLVTAGYTFSTAHEFISDVGGGNIVARSPALGSKTQAGGVLDAADTTVVAVSGSVVTQLIIAFDNGTDSTSRLIAKITSYAGLPLTPSGADVPIVFPNDANKIMTI
jgi:hypothetical protein